MPPFALLLLAGLCAVPVAAQQPQPWNSPRVLELVQRAQARRATTLADTGLVSYQAEARGHVYFFLDRRDTGDRSLVKTDQVALEVFWRAPAQTKQRIVGWRDQKTLPTNIRYHIDHLAIVQDNFGDQIRLGDGDEVRDVPHPTAPDAPTLYDYRLADSTTIQLPGAQEPVRVYEVQVRPRDSQQPAFVGSIFVDQRRGDLVRMDFTFTPAAYVDRQLDYINVSLDNGLWKGRFWLPNQQRIEIRRQLPELDFPAGAVIRGNMRVGGYRFNEPLSPLLFAGPPVVLAPRAQRESFAFEGEIHDELREAGGIDPEPDLEAIRSQALELARARVLSGLPRSRLAIGPASEVFRFNRAEGVVLSAGASLRPTEAARLGVRGGWAFGAGHPLGEVEVETRAGGWALAGSLFGNQPRDVGIAPAASGVLNTLAGLFAGEDFTEPFFASGARLGVRRSTAWGWDGWGAVRAEDHQSAAREVGSGLFGDSFDPVRPIDEGWVLGGALGMQRTPPTDAARGWGADAWLEAGSLDVGDTCSLDCDSTDASWLKPRATVAWIRRWTPRDAALEATAAAGFALGKLPRQELYLIGGRGTLPGFGFRAFGGDRFGVAQAVASADLSRPWLRGRVLGALGVAGAGDPGQDALARWGAVPTDGVRGSVGVGVGVFYDILRVDLARGLGSNGRWELIVETRPSFWSFL